MLVVYKYGLLPPTINGESVRTQMRLGHNYRNDLTRFSQERREASRHLEGHMEREVSDALARKELAEKAVEESKRLMKQTNQKSRSRSATQEMKEAHKELKKVATQAKKSWQDARHKFMKDPVLVEARKELWRVAGEQDAKAYLNYKLQGLSWGTRGLVRDAIKRANKMPLYHKGEPCDPQFKRWEGEGTLGVDLYQMGSDGVGISVPDLMSALNDAGRWVHIQPGPAKFQSPARSEAVSAHRARNAARRQAALANGKGRQIESLILSVRIGTLPGTTEPMWACWPIILHRPLPPQAIIRRVRVHLKRIGPREEWSVDFTIMTPEVVVDEDSGMGTVAVDIGWREVAGGLQAARWIDQEGNSGVLVLSDRDAIKPGGRKQNRGSNGGLRSGLCKADDLQSIRDRNFDAAKSNLITFLRTIDVPEWMCKLTVKRTDECPSQAQAIAYLSAWKSPGRLAYLCKRWSSARFDGDSVAFETLESWRYHDYHLWAWESSQRTSSTRRRSHLYRNFAVQLSKYKTVLINDTDYSVLAKKPSPDEDPTIKAANLSRTHVAPGILRSTIEEIVQSKGGIVHRVAGSSTLCPSCGTDDRSHKDENSHRTVCTHCTYDMDADATACFNRMKSHGLETDVANIIQRSSEIADKLVYVVKGGTNDRAAE